MDIETIKNKLKENWETFNISDCNYNTSDFEYYHISDIWISNKNLKENIANNKNLELYIYSAINNNITIVDEYFLMNIIEELKSSNRNIFNSFFKPINVADIKQWIFDTCTKKEYGEVHYRVMKFISLSLNCMLDNMYITKTSSIYDVIFNILIISYIERKLLFDDYNIEKVSRKISLDDFHSVKSYVERVNRFIVELEVLVLELESLYEIYPLLYYNFNELEVHYNDFNPHFKRLVIKEKINRLNIEIGYHKRSLRALNVI